MPAQTQPLSEELQKAAAAFLGAGSLASLAVAVFLLAAAALGVLYVIQATAPGITARSGSALRERNALSFVLGIPVFVAFLVLLSIAERIPEGLRLALLLFIVASVLLGWATASEDLGRRLFLVSSREGSRASHLAAGWLVLCFGSLFPVLGWFVVLPYLTLSGLGSLLAATLRRSGNATAPVV